MSVLTFNCIKASLAKEGKQSTELAAHLGVTTRTVSTWCTNKNQPPVETIFQIARFLGMEAGELLTLQKDLKQVMTKKPAAVPKTADPKTAVPKKGAVGKPVTTKAGRKK